MHSFLIWLYSVGLDEVPFEILQRWEASWAGEKDHWAPVAGACRDLALQPTAWVLPEGAHGSRQRVEVDSFPPRLSYRPQIV